jgi:hypothetical protein
MRTFAEHGAEASEAQATLGVAGGDPGPSEGAGSAVARWWRSWRSSAMTGKLVATSVWAGTKPTHKTVRSRENAMSGVSVSSATTGTMPRGPPRSRSRRSSPGSDSISST